MSVPPPELPMAASRCGSTRGCWRAQADPAQGLHHDQPLHAHAAGERLDAIAVAHGHALALAEVVGAEDHRPAAGDVAGHALIAGRSLPPLPCPQQRTTSGERPPAGSAGT